ncbi:phosphate ABC transporter permease subunit PstC [Actinosynnema sp. ALI-1.44]|uniref:phosphate ABC transporter permease subunit PstC n=1 Tax=Actinosynnema sp. ALI-1.44 TaxID=1933779 RepID=UPI00097BBFC7|nr:phosphate ABC transporter permease subunit PstC [Actinosynnema sp. ALI-1.44]ONI77744.1 phosphate ABC transporter permease subunit PstC [Actinosynnema sp. ALI-1.44]
MTTQVDRPRPVRPSVPVSDRVFRGTVRAAGIAVLVIMGAIGLFLAYQAVPTLRQFGWGFFTEPSFIPNQEKLGIAAVGLFTLQVAGVAIVLAFPLALATALYISEYAPARLRRTLIAILDLMAAIPSVVYGLFGFVFLTPHMIYLSRWLSKYLGFLPFFDVRTDVNAASWEQSLYTSSPFIAGVVVAMMVLPFAASIMREVFSQAPLGEREGALALGSTRWGVIRSVVLPFGKGGVIGGTMLALGRALGETIAVVMILAPVFDIRLRILENGGVTISSLIALRFGEATQSQLSSLMAAGLVLFLFTLVVNTVASTIVARTRSGSATEI